ncbi:MAG: phytanoyl-CoA dioxygenase family protein [Burkholderiaceae bacterium]
MAAQTMPTASTPILPGQVSRNLFEQNGYVCPVPVLTPDEARNYRDLYLSFHEAHESRLAALKAGQRWRINADTHFAFQWVDELTRHPKILDAVEQLLGPDLLAWNTNWFVKMPHDRTFVSWHQDGAYWGLSPTEVATAWVALSPATPENGCMRVLPGSHHKTHLPQRDTYAEDNVLSRGQEIAVAVNEREAVDLELRPGEMSLHHLWIVHGSNANQSDGARIGVAIRYVSTRVKQDSPEPPFAMLVRGHDQHGHFRLTERPTRNDGFAGEGRHAVFLQRVHSALAKGKPPNPV